MSQLLFRREAVREKRSFWSAARVEMPGSAAKLIHRVAPNPCKERFCLLFLSCLRRREINYTGFGIFLG
ncbi:hypothetical protein JTE90_023544 [Oedothorax gibbosus]|uniref:Uncharacterized protein n=1 Tax=Oedothorax gibbosus TaxID=931172 RepID=A0AAV6UJE1_9ARAC|nr:hypothetical protein JTE90_023544 [Oedothorax gibbosus]